MKYTDGKRTIEIKIQRWTGSGWGEDWSNDFFAADDAPYDEENDVYVVDDVADCIAAAESDNPDEGACFALDEDGEPFLDPDVAVTVIELPTVPTTGALE